MLLSQSKKEARQCAPMCMRKTVKISEGVNANSKSAAEELKKCKTSLFVVTY